MGWIHVLVPKSFSSRVFCHLLVMRENKVDIHQLMLLGSETITGIKSAPSKGPMATYNLTPTGVADQNSY